MYRKKVTAKLLITDLLIIVLKFFVLNFKCITIHVGIEISQMKFKFMYVCTFSVPCCSISLK